MRKVGLLLVLSFLLVASVTVSAVTFDGDASYLLGVSSQKGSGFAVHAKAELIDQVFVDGSFLTSSAEKAEGQTRSLGHQLVTAGALYRPVIDADLHVFVGGGYAGLTVNPVEGETAKGSGLYGKFGFKMIPTDQLTLEADLIFAPRYKVDEESGSLTTARATLGYEVYPNLKVQATLKHYKASPGEVKNTLVGGGLSFSF